LFSVSAQEQNDLKTDTISNGFYILPTQLVFVEIILSFEYFIKDKYSLTYSLGYKIPVGKGTELNLPFGMGLEYQHYDPMFNYFAHAVYISFAPAYYFSSDRKFYLQSELFYRYYWFNDQQLNYYGENSAESYNSLRSERANVFGIKLLAGYNAKVSISKKLLFNAKFYSGLGFRYKNYTYLNIDNQVPDENGDIIVVPYEEIKGFYFAPSFQLGVKIGIATKTTKMQ
jgi:hypothetical protein